MQKKHFRNTDNHHTLLYKMLFECTEKRKTFFLGIWRVCASASASASASVIGYRQVDGMESSIVVLVCEV